MRKFKRKESTPREVVCAMCGKTFLATHSQAKFCPGECRQLSLRASWNKYSANNREMRRVNGRINARKYRITHSEKISAYINSARFKQWRAWQDKIRREECPEKYAARMAVGKAKRKGLLLPESCQVCGNPKTEAHHEDYSKPLEVIWLCKKHHVQLHEQHKGVSV